jgi:hypothetical protein
MIKTVLRKLILLLWVAAILAGCAVSPADEAAIAALVARQQAAMAACDADAMLETVTPGDAWYRTETANLVLDQRTAPVDNYTLTVLDVRETGDSVWEATLEQKYIADGERRSCRSVHRYGLIDGQLYDLGLACEQAQYGEVTVYYPGGYDEMARGIARTINDYLDGLSAEWGYTPQSGIAVKLYDDHEVFLQSIKLTLPGWVGGWHENGEAIKIYAVLRNAEPYESMMRHEATHTALSELTGDNAAYWMQEGFAVLLEDSGTGALDAPSVRDMNALIELYGRGRLPALADHLSANPERLTDPLDVRGYYAYSNAMVVWLLLRCGRDRIPSLFDALKEFETIPGVAAAKIEPLNERTAAALRKAAGVEFGEEFEKWLVEQIRAAG